MSDSFLQTARSDRVVCARLSIGLPVDERLERDRAEHPLVLLLHFVPDLVHDVRRADPIGVRVGLLVDAVQRRQDGMNGNFGRLTSPTHGRPAVRACS